METTTYSMWSCFRNCRRQCHWRYREGLRRIGDDADALVTGSLVHQCLEAWYLDGNIVAIDKVIDSEMYAMQELADETTRRRWAVTRAMLHAYANHYFEQDANWRIIGLEMPFSGDIVNPATGVKSRSFTLEGKVDGVVETPDGLFLLEHKTTSRIDAGYLDRLWSDMQIQLYSHYLHEAYGFEIVGTIYNILQKPAGTMKQRVGETSLEFEQRKEVAVAEGKNPNRLRQSLPESDEEFEQRLRDWYADAPDERFHREVLLFTPTDTADLLAELWELTQQYLGAAREGVRAFYKNTSFCWVYNHPCDYVPICRASCPEAVIREFFTREIDNVHPELNSNNDIF